MEVREITCIVCPLGCRIIASLEDKRIKEIKGQKCSQGIDYAREEITAPQRMLTTTVLVEKGALPLLPVRTSRPLPKEKIFSCLRILSALKVKAPIRMGDPILKDVLGTGVDILASRNLEAIE